MQRQSRLLSIRRLWRSPLSIAVRLRRLIGRPRLTEEDVDAIFARRNDKLRQGLWEKASCRKVLRRAQTSKEWHAYRMTR
jgi:hypothetical protein